LVIIVPRDLDLSRHEKTLDPPPQQKWAEEGYAVAQILDDGRFSIADQLRLAIAKLEELPECSGDKIGLVPTSDT
jgi:carboxymethylenebutenolidase